MSTENTEIKENTSTETEVKTNDNKKVFGPLGKYAVVAVIMVSIIVTTAIMLNKQLGSVEEQLAEMENEVAEMNDANTVSAVTSDAVETTTEAATGAQEAVEVTETNIAPVAVQTTEVQAVKTTSAEVLVATENTEEAVSEVAISTVQISSTDTVLTEPTMSKNAVIDDQFELEMAQRGQERQARIEAYKLAQKQHMTEMFARIKTLEAQQLDKYKTEQDEQVERLRQQIAKQEQLIEALILRNKEWVEMRAASMQRSQSHREKMLDRI